MEVDVWKYEWDPDLELRYSSSGSSRGLQNSALEAQDLQQQLFTLTVLAAGGLKSRGR